MANYKVMIQVGARPVPTMNSTSAYQVPVGFTFESSVIRADAYYGSPMLVQMPDGTWVPLIYRNMEYVTQYTPVPPSPSETKHFTLSIDGYQTFSGDLIPLV